MWAVWGRSRKGRYAENQGAVHSQAVDHIMPDLHATSNRILAVSAERNS